MANASLSGIFFHQILKYEFLSIFLGCHFEGQVQKVWQWSELGQHVQKGREYKDQMCDGDMTAISVQIGV